MAARMSDDVRLAPWTAAADDGSVEPSPRPAADAIPEARPASSGARSARVDRRKQFSLLVVRGDGARVIRFNFARPVALGSFVSLLAVAAVSGAIVGDYVKLRKLSADAVNMATQLETQRSTIDAFNRRVADLREEMAGWQEMHARIQQPFGPELTASARERGVGGAAAKEPRLPIGSPADELNRLADVIEREGESLKALDRLMARAGKALAALPSRWPVRGGVNSEFGMRQSPWSREREFHAGLDIGANMGTPVKAPAAGTVIVAGAYGEYGNAVILDHGQDIRSLYGHLSRPAVRRGDRVERGTIVGYSGNTGRSSGPHLHYEVMVKGKTVNPRSYLWD